MLVGQALAVWDKAVVISIKQNSLHYKQSNLYEMSFYNRKLLLYTVPS